MLDLKEKAAPAIPHLIRLSKSDDPKMRMAAMAVLASIGWYQVSSNGVSGVGEVLVDITNFDSRLWRTLLPLAFRPGVLTVNLVDDDHRRQSEGEGLRQHVAGLRKRALSGIDKEDDAVDHRKCSLYLATEVRVAWGVDEIDLDVIPRHRSGLRENRDASLAFLVVRVHDSVDNSGVVTERTRRTQERIDEGGLAVVNVSDERDVTKRD